MKHDSGTRYLKKKWDVSRVILVLLIREFGFARHILIAHVGVFVSIAVHPTGNSYASGGEDGFVRVHHFDDTYFRAKPYGDLEIED